MENVLCSQECDFLTQGLFTFVNKRTRGYVVMNVVMACDSGQQNLMGPFLEYVYRI